MELTSDIWSLLQELGDAGAAISLQWIPGDAGIGGRALAPTPRPAAGDGDQTHRWKRSWDAPLQPSLYRKSLRGLQEKKKKLHQQTVESAEKITDCLDPGSRKNRGQRRSRQDSKSGLKLHTRRKQD